MGDWRAPTGGTVAAAPLTETFNAKYYHRKTAIARRLRGAQSMCGKFARFVSIIAHALETDDGPPGLAGTREEAAYSLHILAKHLRGKGRREAYIAVMAGFLELNFLGDP